MCFFHTLVTIVVKQIRLACMPVYGIKNMMVFFQLQLKVLFRNGNKEVFA